MTVNELIEALQKLADAGHGELDAFCSERGIVGTVYVSVYSDDEPIVMLD